ncbi:hypothetical protein ALC60_03516 [Trachymyrmex zeteki]|uniref:Uncharacterized protein n=1 Tax=Mycetomoellerius zeteki TaxID=64791 RepID=A0A151XB29_9HYME|nr:hypothetical protein ALC60_03516 [Trachymyrmex zeteki]
MWSPSCSAPKCILALTDPPAGNDKYGPLTVLSGLVYIDTVHETVKRNASANSRMARPRSLAPAVRLPSSNRGDELHGCTFLLRTYSRRRNTDGTRRHRRILSRRRRSAAWRGMVRHELIREYVRIVEKQCITPDNKQIEAGQKGEREKERGERERERATLSYMYLMQSHVTKNRALLSKEVEKPPRRRGIRHDDRISFITREGVLTTGVRFQHLHVRTILAIRDCGYAPSGQDRVKMISSTIVMNIAVKTEILYAYAVLLLRYKRSGNTFCNNYDWGLFIRILVFHLDRFKEETVRSPDLSRRKRKGLLRPQLLEISRRVITRDKTSVIFLSKHKNFVY